MKKNDYKLIGGILIISVILLVLFGQIWKNDGSVVEIRADGKVIGTYLLSAEQSIEIGETNTLVIKNQKADMTEANCPDKLCVKQKAISKNGESIVCLPNKVTVTVISDEAGEDDAVVK